MSAIRLSRFSALLRGAGTGSLVTATAMHKLIRCVWNHPLNVRGGRAAAPGRVFRWQIASRLMPGPIGLPYVDDTFLFATRGQAGGGVSRAARAGDARELEPGPGGGASGVSARAAARAASSVGSNQVCVRPWMGRALR